MGTSAPIDITDCHFFAEPATARQRQYEALRAFFLDGLTSKEVAHRFSYSHGAFRVLCHDFRRGLLPQFFATTRPGPREQPKKSKARDQVLALRKRNYSIYDISRALKLKQQGNFRDLIDMPADVTISDHEVKVRFHRRAHLPILLASGLIDKPVPVPWWDGRPLRLAEQAAPSSRVSPFPVRGN